jgi:hypothetical protein
MKPKWQLLRWFEFPILDFIFITPLTPAVMNLSYRYVIVARTQVCTHYAMQPQQKVRMINDH